MSHTFVNHIVDNLYLTSFKGAQLFFENPKQNWVCVLVAKELVSEFDKIKCPFKWFIELDDCPQEDLLPHINEILALITNSRLDRKNCLIFCKMGISRSASFCIAYMIKNYYMPFEDAFNFVKKKRHIIYPNRGFVKQLKIFERNVSRQ